MEMLDALVTKLDQVLSNMDQRVRRKLDEPPMQRAPDAAQPPLPPANAARHHAFQARQSRHRPTTRGRRVHTAGAELVASSYRPDDASTYKVVAVTVLDRLYLLIDTLVQQ